MKKIELISKYLKDKGLKAATFERNSGLSNGYVSNMLKKQAEISDDKLQKVYAAYPEIEKFIELGSNKTVGQQIREQKAFGETKKVLKFVPIKAQAGYAQHRDEPVYIDQLQELDIPENPYVGDNYRCFEVEGDSMEYYDKEGRPAGIAAGEWIIAERVEDLNNTVQYYIHVIVTADRIMVKRLYRKGMWFACISDNSMYPQFPIHVKDIKELWIVKRKITWNMPPPNRIEINIDLPE